MSGRGWGHTGIAVVEKRPEKEISPPIQQQQFPILGKNTRRYYYQVYAF